jgi:hypothetical protein
MLIFELSGMDLKLQQFGSWSKITVGEGAFGEFPSGGSVMGQNKNGSKIRMDQKIRQPVAGSI